VKQRIAWQFADETVIETDIAQIDRSARAQGFTANHKRFFTVKERAIVIPFYFTRAASIIMAIFP
jgi:hypothetical protein